MGSNFAEIRGSSSRELVGETERASLSHVVKYLSCLADNLNSSTRQMNNPHKTRRGLDRLTRAWQSSFDGLSVAFRSEEAFRQEIGVAAILIPAALWVGESYLEIVVLVGSVMLVLIVELLNTAVEATVDRISLETHELSKCAKDLGSAAVLMSITFCTFVWFLAMFRLLTR